MAEDRTSILQGEHLLSRGRGGAGSAFLEDWPGSSID